MSRTATKAETSSDASFARRLNAAAAETEQLLYRGAQEGLRNTLLHAGASTVVIAVEVDGGRACLTVDDDGRGVSARDRERARDDGHVGLDLLAALVADAHGTLKVAPRAPRGTRLRLEVPVA